MSPLFISFVLNLSSEWGQGRTDEVEAEDGKEEGAEERKDLVERDEGGVEEGGDGGVDEDVQHDLDQPAGGQPDTNYAHGQLEPEAQDGQHPPVVRVLPLPELHMASFNLQQCSMYDYARMKQELR